MLKLLKYLILITTISFGYSSNNIRENNSNFNQVGNTNDYVIQPKIENKNNKFITRKIIRNKDTNNTEKKSEINLNKKQKNNINIGQNINSITNYNKNHYCNQCHRNYSDFILDQDTLNTLTEYLTKPFTQSDRDTILKEVSEYSNNKLSSKKFNNIIDFINMASLYTLTNKKVKRKVKKNDEKYIFYNIRGNNINNNYLNEIYSLSYVNYFLRYLLIKNRSTTMWIVGIMSNTGTFKKLNNTEQYIANNIFKKVKYLTGLQNNMQCEYIEKNLIKKARDNFIISYNGNINIICNPKYSYFNAIKTLIDTNEVNNNTILLQEGDVYSNVILNKVQNEELMNDNFQYSIDSNNTNNNMQNEIVILQEEKQNSNIIDSNVTSLFIDRSIIKKDNSIEEFEDNTLDNKIVEENNKYDNGFDNNSVEFHIYSTYSGKYCGYDDTYEEDVNLLKTPKNVYPSYENQIKEESNINEKTVNDSKYVIDSNVIGFDIIEYHYIHLNNIYNDSESQYYESFFFPQNTINNEVDELYEGILASAKLYRLIHKNK